MTVNLLPASFTRDGQELVITPKGPLRRGKTFFVKVEYRGEPTEVIDPDGSSEGWVPTADGAFVVNEPQGSTGWFPANDNPRDKATYDMAITVPNGITAIGNGRLLAKRDHGGQTAQAAFDQVYARPANSSIWTRPPGDVGGPEFLFTGTVYDRGAATLQALRVKVGDKTFFRIIREWYAHNRDGNVTTAGFVRLAQKRSGERLGACFDTWLYQPVKPTTW